MSNAAKIRVKVERRAQPRIGGRRASVTARRGRSPCGPAGTGIGGRRMFFLVRTAFWFSLVLLVLPLDAGRAPGSPPPVSPLAAMSAAREAIGDVAGLCERKPDVCVTGKAAFETIGSRA